MGSLWRALRIITNNEQNTKRPRVFISYAQCSEVHSACVLALAQALRGHGIDTELDRYDKHELIDWPRWCQQQLRSDHAACVLIGYLDLYRLLTDQCEIAKAPLGPPLALEPRSPALVRGAVTAIESLPTREELAYLDRLLAGIELKARLYAPLRGIADVQPSEQAAAMLAPWADDEDIALLQDLHDAWLPRLTDLDRDAKPEARAAIGRALGRIGRGDRNGVDLSANGLPDIDWVEIPGGAFIYQDDERRQCENFRISRYPVTNAQFQAFVDSDDSYPDDRWWLGLDDPDRNPEQPSWDYPNHPRETVSWPEAMAFCAWLSHRLKLDIRLPTEWEWERAARGINCRVYPWGDEYLAGHANVDETWKDTGSHNLDRTCAVGLYPQGASPEGVLDLSGNVWEWCLNE